MVFDWTVVSAHVSAGFIADALIRPADDQKAAWVLEFARLGGVKVRAQGLYQNVQELRSRPWLIPPPWA
ncbi:hypothetical protein [Azotobacter salinestris]|uniref:hypothetical protein n=1 Tax=Azotobacter salinestris TaxID=69964 RepID=UPI001266DD5F|nr:hypothetical protein [Azotobacter salinestris]